MLLRVIDVPEFIHAITWEVWIDINVHSAFKAETGETIVYLIVGGHFSSVLKVRTSMDFDDFLAAYDPLWGLISL